METLALYAPPALARKKESLSEPVSHLTWDKIKKIKIKNKNVQRKLDFGFKIVLPKQTQLNSTLSDLMYHSQGGVDIYFSALSCPQ